MGSTELEQICNFLEISGMLGTAGQPSPQQFSAIKQAGYEVVINLAMPTSTNALPNEGELVAEQGMDYVHLPVVWEAPSTADFYQFCSVMLENRGRRIFVHCALNMRVSAFVFMYRVLYQGTPLEVAEETLFKIWHPDGIWQDLIHRILAAPPEF